MPSLVVLGLSGAALLQWFYFIAIERLPVGIALLIEFTGPLLVAVYSAVVLREAVRPRLWLALGIALGGMALVAQVWEDLGLDTLGVAAAVASAVCLATFYLLSKRSVAGRDPLSLTAWMFAFGALFWAVAQPWWYFDTSILTEEVSLLGTFADVTAPVWLALVWVVVLGTLVPYALEVASLRHLPPTITGLVAMVEPVIAGAVRVVVAGGGADRRAGRSAGCSCSWASRLVQTGPDAEVEATPAVDLVVVLGGVGLRLGAVDGAVGVLGRRVQRVQLHVARPHVADVVPGAGRHDERPVVAHRVGLVDGVLRRAQVELGLALLDAQELVEVVVHLPADLLAGEEPHHRELRVATGEHDRAEVSLSSVSFSMSPIQPIMAPVYPLARRPTAVLDPPVKSDG